MTDNTLAGRLAGQVREQDTAFQDWEAEREAIRIVTETTGAPAAQICRDGALAEAERRRGGWSLFAVGYGMGNLDVDRSFWCLFWLGFVGGALWLAAGWIGRVRRRRRW